MPKKIYVASPLGFSEVSRDFYYKKLIPEIESCGFQVLDPWELAPLEKVKKVSKMPFDKNKLDAWKIINMEIGECNRQNIDLSDGVVAVLDGVDVDSGTASEIGYAYAKGKPILGYRGDFRLSADNIGGIVNLQVEYFIRKSGGTIITEFKNIKKELIHILA